MNSLERATAIKVYQRSPMPSVVESSLTKKFGRLTIVSYLGKASRKPRVLCRCDCGNEKVIDIYSIRSGYVRSCGCLHSEVASSTAKKRCTTHGLTKSRAYSMWRDMHTRCENPKFKFYRYYGGRGISVCKQWTGKGGFSVFIKDMGIPKPGDTLERMDNDKGYSPDNCKWIPWGDQAKNRRYNWKVNFCGNIITAIDAAKILGRSRGFVDQRLRNKGFNKLEPVPFLMI